MKKIRSSNYTLLLAVVLHTGVAKTQNIMYMDIDPDKMITGTDAYALRLDKEPDSVVYGENGSFVVWDYDPGILLVTYTDCQVQMDGTYPAALTTNDSIGGTGIWSNANYAQLYSGGVGHWSNAIDKYMGIRFKTGGSQWFYGWVRMDVSATGSSVTIKDYAFNNLPSEAIKAGQKADFTGISQVVSDPDIRISAMGNVINVNGAANSSVVISDLSGRMLKKTKILHIS